MKVVEKVVERFSSPIAAWDNIERHQNTRPMGTFWVRQVYDPSGLDWAVVQEVQEPWEPLNL